MQHSRLLLLFLWATLACLSLPQACYTQTTSGKLVDAQTEQGLAWATVSTWNLADQSLLAATLSDEQGAFNLVLPGTDSFRLEIQLLGYESYSSPLYYSSTLKELKLGQIRLQPKVNELTAVTVSAKRKALVSLAGGYQINNSAQLSLVNPNAQALLKQAPGVSIHPLRGIEVMGKSNVLVKIDGKPVPIGGRELVSFLADLSAEEVKSIRIITTPSASEQAGNGGGTIEITTNRKDKKGVFAQSSIDVGTQSKIKTGAAAIYNTERLSLYGRLTARDQQFIIQEEDYYTDLRENSPGASYDYVSQHTEKIQSWGSQGSIDYQAGKNTTVGAIVRYNEFLQNNASQKNQTQYFDQDRQWLYAREWQAGSSFKNQRQYYNLSFRSDLGRTGQFLTSDYALTLHNRYNGIELLPVSPPGPSEEEIMPIRNFANYDVQIHRAQVDYQRDIRRHWKAETGARFDRVLVNNQFNNLQQLGGTDTRVEELNYKENILGLYANFQGQYESLSLEAGIRVEGTALVLVANQQTEKSEFSRIRWNVFPSLLMKYQLNEAHSLSWTLSRRIDRPPYYVLNPYNYNPNPNITDQGNPSLAPALDHRAELSYSGSWNESFSTLFSAGHSCITDFYAYITQENKDGQYINYPVNIQSAQETYISLYTNYGLTDWWTVNTNLLMSRMNFNGEDFGVAPTKVIPSYSLSLGQQFDLGSDFSGQIQAEYSSAQTTLYGQGNGYQSIDLSLGKTFGQLKCQLEVTDLFNRDENRWVLRSAALRYHGRWKYESRVAYLRLKWSFGRYVKSKAKRYKGRQDERYEGR